MSKRFRVFHQLQIAHAALFRAADQRTRTQTGLSTAQMAVLFCLSKEDGQPIGAISKTLAMGKSGLTGLVDRMVERGLVRRTPSAADGRVTLIHLEPLGRDLLDRAKDETAHFNAALLAPFSAEEQATIARFLTHLAENAADIINGHVAPTSDTETKPKGTTDE